MAELKPHSICDGCQNTQCPIQSGIVREHCAMFQHTKELMNAQDLPDENQLWTDLITEILRFQMMKALYVHREVRSVAEFGRLMEGTIHDTRAQS